jgi:hypothetical protein
MVTRTDFDDRLINYGLVFFGLAFASLAHAMADRLGWDLWKLFRRGNAFSFYKRRKHHRRRKR